MSILKKRSRCLDVFLHQKLAGRLILKDSGAISFTYGSDYVAHGYPTLSVSLPLRDKPYRNKAVTAFFFGALPAGVCKRQSFSRFLRSWLWGHISGPFACNQRIRYLYLSDQARFAWLADRGMSADSITLYPCGTTPAQSGTSDKPELVLNGKLIKEISLDPCPALTSMGGARKKMAVRIDKKGKVVWIRDKRAVASTHILKIIRTKDAAFNELFCMRLAKAVGLNVPACEVHFFDEIPCYLVARYDREQFDQEVKILHQETLCQALGILPGVYAEHRGGPSIKDCLTLLRNQSSAPTRDITAFLAEVVFSYLIGRFDMNGWNCSLLYRNGRPELAPTHDLNSFFDRSKMNMSIGGEQRPEKIKIKHWNSAVECTERPILYEELDRLSQITPKQADSLIDQYKSGRTDTKKLEHICTKIAQRASLVRQQLPEW